MSTAIKKMKKRPIFHKTKNTHKIRKEYITKHIKYIFYTIVATFILIYLVSPSPQFTLYTYIQNK